MYGIFTHIGVVSEVNSPKESDLAVQNVSS